MYRNRLKDGLKPDELEAARLGFNRYLRRKRFSPQFISRYAEDLFAQAALEYSRKRAEGIEIENPPGWLIECAWRRTKSQLEAEARSPRLVGLEGSGPLADSLDHDPEDALLESERFRKLRQAVGKLPVEQRRVLAFSYFEGCTIREAGRRLRWHASKAQRAHEGAKERLHELLGADSADDLAIEIGLAAYLSFISPAAGSIQVPAGFEATAQSVRDGARHLWARGHELLGRFSTSSGGRGVEVAGAAASDGSQRVAEACKVLAVCLVGGTAALGGGQLVNQGGTQTDQPDRATRRSEDVASRSSTAQPTGALTEESSAATAPTNPTTHRRGEGASATEIKRRKDERQAEAQFGAFAQAESAKTSGDSPDTTAGASSATASPPPSEGTTAVRSQAAPAEERQVTEQFGAFK